MKTLFILICLGVFSYSAYSQFDFSSATGWTRVDVEYPGPGPLPPVQSPTARIDINSGVLNFINAPDAPNDIRYHREILPLCDNWVSEFDFEATSGNLDTTKSQDIGYIPFALTENTENPSTKTIRDNWSLSSTPTDNNVIGAYVRGDGSPYNLYIAPFSKLTAMRPGQTDQ